MRVFSSADGRSWRARISDGPAADRAGAGGTGWEAILFDAVAGEPAQRLVYRPVGWLAAATDAELAAAIEDAEAVRTRWGPEPQQAGG